MYLPPLGMFLLAAGSAHLCSAHTAFTNFFIDGKNQGDGVAVRMSDNPGHATFPIKGITSPEMACGVNGEKGVARIAPANAGSTITFEWRDYPDGSQPGAIDKSHKGPCAVYMKKVENAAASDNAAGDGWFKIMEYGYDSGKKQWCTEMLDAVNGHLQATIPKHLAPAYYLLRPELLALHQADKNPPDPQFYVGCAQIFLSSSGNSQPKDHVSIPGYVDMKTPAMTFNVWQEPLKPFTPPGPPVYTASKTPSKLRARGMLQTYGLKPSTCIMQNANWCGYTPPSYNDQDGCWASAKNCSVQTDHCYKSAPPTGSKNCKNWETYCTDIRNQCNAKNYQGPPSCDSHMPIKPAPMSGGALSAPDDGAAKTQPESVNKEPANQLTASAVAQSSIAPSSAQYAPVVPVATPVYSGNGAVTAGGNESSTGSIDECGSRGGQTCKTGMCCSVNGSGGQTYSFHLLPSGLINPNVDNLIGPGVVFNPEAFFKEINSLECKGLPRVHERIHISSRCHINFALHAAVDGLSEAELGTSQIGTTKKGIGPAYSTKALRDGIRVIDLYKKSFEPRLRSLAEGYRKRYGELLKYSVEDEIQSFRDYKEVLRPYIVNHSRYMKAVRENNRSVLIESSQGLMLDLEFGSYPFVTATHCSLGGCIQGLVLRPLNIKSVIGVVKAYTTRVGEGPLPTEQSGDVGKQLQEIGKEIGVSTGRTRRCGWLDLVVLKYSAEINDYTSLNLTKLDVLDTFPIIRVAVAYITSDGEKLESFPEDLDLLDNCTVEYVDFEGWQSSTQGARTWSDLPSQAQEYIEFIESSVDVKIAYVGTGPDREDMIYRE